MKRWALIALAACAVTTTGCDDGPTTPSSLPLVFTAILSPANEVPSVTNAESGGVGAVQITFEVTRDAANAITGATANFYFQVSGFPANTTVIGAHTHPGAAGVVNDALVPALLMSGPPFSVNTGTGEFRVSGIRVDAAIVQAIVNNPAEWYFNIHSPLNRGGFARGQLTRIQ